MVKHSEKKEPKKEERKEAKLPPGARKMMEKAEKKGSKPSRKC